MIVAVKTRADGERLLEAARDEGMTGAIHYHKKLDGTALGFVKLDIEETDYAGLRRIEKNPRWGQTAWFLGRNGYLCNPKGIGPRAKRCRQEGRCAASR